MACRTTVPFVLGASLLVGGCSGSLGETLGLSKRAPDEFAVVRHQPLIMPPDYDLRPPDPAARGPVPRRPDAQARATLTGVPVEQRTQAGAGAAAGAAAATGRPGAGGTSGESVLIRRTAEVPVDPEIRTRLAEEGGGAAEVDPQLFERLTVPGSGSPPGAQDALTDPDAASQARGDLSLIRRSSAPLEDL